MDHTEETADSLEARSYSKLERIRAEVRESPDPGARLFNQWGDAAAELGREEEALVAYGKAIDSYIETGRARMAIAMCEKVIRNHPDVTRTHFTHSCLVLSRGLVAECERALDAYTAAALASHTEGMAIPRLRFFTGVVVQPAIREAIARNLAALGDSEGALVALGPPPSPSGVGDAQRTRFLLQAATTVVDRLWAKFWLTDAYPQSDGPSD